MVCLRLGMHYQCSWAVITGRDHGPWTRVPFWTRVFAGRVRGCRSTLPMNTARRQGPWTWVVCTEHPWTQPVCTGRVHGCTWAFLTTREHGPYRRPVNTGSVYRGVNIVHRSCWQKCARRLLWQQGCGHGMIDTRYPCSQVVNTARQHGCPKLHPCSRAVFTGREHARYTRVVCTEPTAPILLLKLSLSKQRYTPVDE